MFKTAIQDKLLRNYTEYRSDFLCVNVKRSHHTILQQLYGFPFVKSKLKERGDKKKNWSTYERARQLWTTSPVGLVICFAIFHNAQYLGPFSGTERDMLYLCSQHSIVRSSQHNTNEMMIFSGIEFSARMVKKA